MIKIIKRSAALILLSFLMALFVSSKAENEEMFLYLLPIYTLISMVILGVILLAVWLISSD